MAGNNEQSIFPADWAVMPKIYPDFSPVVRINGPDPTQETAIAEDNTVALSGTLQLQYAIRSEAEETVATWDELTPLQTGRTNPGQYLLEKYRHSLKVLRIMEAAQDFRVSLEGLEDEQSIELARAAAYSIGSNSTETSDRVIKSQRENIQTIRGLIERHAPSLMAHIIEINPVPHFDFVEPEIVEPAAATIRSEYENIFARASWEPSLGISEITSSRHHDHLPAPTMTDATSPETSSVGNSRRESLDNPKYDDPEAWLPPLLASTIYTNEAIDMVNPDGTPTEDAIKARIEERGVCTDAEDLSWMFQKRQTNVFEKRDGIILGMQLRRDEVYRRAIRRVAYGEATEFRRLMKIYTPYQHVHHISYGAVQGSSEAEAIDYLRAGLAELELPDSLKEVGLKSYVEYLDEVIAEKAEKDQANALSRRKERLIQQIQDTDDNDYFAIERLNQILNLSESEGKL